MNFLDLKNMVWSWLDDLDGTYFLPPQVERWINNAQKEVQKQLIQSGQNWYQTCAQTYTVYNQDSYLLPSDFLKINHVTMVTGAYNQGGNEQKQVIKHSTQGESDSVNYTLSLPQTFFLVQDAIILRPYPDQQYLMRLGYDYRVADMVLATDIPDVPYQYQEYIAVLATIDGFLKDQRDPSPFFAKKAYYEDMMKKDAQDRMVDKPRSVVITGGGGGGYLF